MKLKIGLAQNILYQFNIFCTGTKTNCTKVQIELQHMYMCSVSFQCKEWRLLYDSQEHGQSLNRCNFIICTFLKQL